MVSGFCWISTYFWRNDSEGADNKKISSNTVQGCGRGIRRGNAGNSLENKKKQVQCYRGFEMPIFYFMAPDRVAKAGMTPRGRHSTPRSLWSLLLLNQAIAWLPPYPRRSLLRWISPGVGRGLLRGWKLQNFSAGEGKRSLLTCSQEKHLGTSMVAQGLRLHLSMQGVQVQSLLRELRFPHAWGPKTKTKNRNNIVTNSMKTFKMVHIKKKKKKHLSWGLQIQSALVCFLLSDGPSGHPVGGRANRPSFS